MIKRNPVVTIKKEAQSPKNTSITTVYDLKDFDVLIEDPIIKGLSAPSSDIIISTVEKDFYTKTNSEGEFEIQIELPSGLSEVKINELKLILVFSTEVEKAKTSYVGTVTDISSGTIQVKGSKSGILQISVNSETNYVNTLKKNAEVKETDLAIGDYIVAMGIPSANKVLETERILITSPLPESKIEVEKIEIEKLSKTVINDIKLPTKWVGPNVKDLEIGQEIYVVGIRSDNKFDLRSIFVVQ